MIYNDIPDSCGSLPLVRASTSLGLKNYANLRVWSSSNHYERSSYYHSWRLDTTLVRWSLQNLSRSSDARRTPIHWVCVVTYCIFNKFATDIHTSVLGGVGYDVHNGLWSAFKSSFLLEFPAYGGTSETDEGQIFEAWVIPLSRFPSLFKRMFWW